MLLKDIIYKKPPIKNVLLMSYKGSIYTPIYGIFINTKHSKFQIRLNGELKTLNYREFRKYLKDPDSKFLLNGKKYKFKTYHYSEYISYLKGYGSMELNKKYLYTPKERICITKKEWEILKKANLVVSNKFTDEWLYLKNGKYLTEKEWYISSI